ncbi:GPW/gp25 family protein [Actinomadura macra]|uniref:GPW/gp25 family protein n=1 Tax=Actinomadura macra TaxID=46164 RepID=UPI0008299C57|nr:GPW/gp25 family protein [Actinomadura macra]
MTGRLMGPAFPFRIESGGVARAVDDDKVEADLRHLLAGRAGERVMLRDYGTAVPARLQEPGSASLAPLLRRDIERALGRFMPEVRLTAPVRVVVNEERLTVVIEYVVRPYDVVRRLELGLP